MLSCKVNPALRILMICTVHFDKFEPREVIRVPRSCTRCNPIRKWWGYFLPLRSRFKGRLGEERCVTTLKAGAEEIIHTPEVPKERII